MRYLFIIISAGLLATALLFPLKEHPKTEFYPAEWNWLQRTFPYGKADRDAYPLALNQRRAMIRQNALKKNTQVNWEFAGPENIGGRVVDIEYNPRNPQIVYVAAATGGVFKSLNGGQSWQAVFDNQGMLNIGDIALDPQHPDTLFVGTGEANGGHNNFPGNGIYKSTDGGQTWEQTGLEESVSIGRILVGSHNGQRVVVAAVGSYFEPNPQRGIYISEDGGHSWNQSLFVTDSTGAIDVILDPNNPDFMLAAMWERVRRPVYRSQTHLYGKTSGIYKTTDGGAHWQALGPANGLPDAQQARVGRIGLALHSSETRRTLYALYTDGSNISGFYRSTDDGAHWQDTGASSTLSDGGGGFSWYFGQVRVHPLHPDTVFVLDVSFMRSEDGGKTWPIRYGYSGPDVLHVDHHALAFHPVHPDTILEGNDGGVNRSDNGGKSWIKAGFLPITQFYEIGLDAQKPERLYGGSQDNGTMRTINGGTADWERIWGGDGFYVLVNPQNSAEIYCEYQFGSLYKTEDDGVSFSFITPPAPDDEPTNWSTPVVMDPQNPSTIYYGTNRIWRSKDSGMHWTAISSDLTRGLEDAGVNTITTIAIAPGDSSVIYAGTADGQVWQSMDYGVNWQSVSDSLPFRWVTRVVVDPQNEGTVYVTYSGLKWGEAQPHVYRSEDFGFSWQNINSNLPDAPVNAIVIDPECSQTIFVGTDVGAFVSFNSGQSWQVLGNGLPAVVVSDMKVHPLTHELVAGTHGRSMYKLDLNKLTSIKPQAQTAQEFELFQNYPNPFNPSTVISYQLPVNSNVELTVYNALGRKVAVLVNQEQVSGQHSVTFDASGLASGVYYYRLKLGSSLSQIRKMTLVK